MDNFSRAMVIGIETLGVVIMSLLILIWVIAEAIDDVPRIQFDFSKNHSFFSYGIVLNVSFRNPNSFGKIYYDDIKATADYQGRRLKSVFVKPFNQGKKNTSVKSLVFEGQNTEWKPPDYSSVFGNKERIGVILSLKAKMKLGSFKSPGFDLKEECVIVKTNEHNSTTPVIMMRLDCCFTNLVF